MISKDLKSIQIIDFEEKHTIDFKNIHLEWFESDFFQENYSAEAYDLKIIANPSKYIIAKGGHIFLAQYDDKIVGTTALIVREDNSFELSKMGILENYRGLKIADELMKYAIEYSRSKAKKTLWLESIRKLRPALSLFRKYGFEEIPLNPKSPYARADIRMALELE